MQFIAYLLGGLGAAFIVVSPLVGCVLIGAALVVVALDIGNDLRS